MKLELKRKEFLEVLGQVQHITERRAHQPILSFVLIKADEKNQLTLLATDLEVFVKAKSKCEKSSNLEVALPARELYDLVKEIDSGKNRIRSKKRYNRNQNKIRKIFYLLSTIISISISTRGRVFHRRLNTFRNTL